jgi:hypothetical protein
MRAATLLLGPCPNSACNRSRIASHADHFAARHVLGKMPQRAARVQDVPSMHEHAPTIVATLSALA